MRILLASIASVVALVLLVPVVLLLAPFFIVAWTTRAIARRLEPSFLTRDELIQFDPVFGWKPRPHLRTHHLMGDLFRIATDADGWRGRATLGQSDMVVIGDSFAAGYGVGEEAIFANLSTRPVVKPIGIGGYSMVQELLWMRELAPALRNKLVVWFVFYGNDLYDNLTPELRGYRKPFVREHRGTGGWEIVSQHISRDKWPIQVRGRKGHIHLTTLAQLCSDTFLARRAYSACEWLIDEGRRVCAAAGAELMVLTIPDPHMLTAEGHDFLRSLEPGLRDFHQQRPDRMFSAICARLGVPIVTGTSFLDMSCYKPNDCHWNEAGHARVAARLRELHEQRTRADVRPAAVHDSLAPGLRARRVGITG
jgi:hypothetical protein